MNKHPKEIKALEIISAIECSKQEFSILDEANRRSYTNGDLEIEIMINCILD